MGEIVISNLDDRIVKHIATDSIESQECIMRTRHAQSRKLVFGADSFICVLI